MRATDRQTRRYNRRPMSHPSGIVLSGGGANGAYEIGVLKALFRGESPANGHQPVEPGVIAATSIGAFNSAVLLSNHTDSWSRAIDALEKVWLEQVSLSGARGPGPKPEARGAEARL